MKKLFSFALAVCMAAGCLLAFASCKKEETLTVYTEAGFAPFEYVKDGKIVGVDVDIMEKVGEKLGKKVKFENVRNTLSEMTSRFFPVISTVPYPPELLIVPNFKG